MNEILIAVAGDPSAASTGVKPLRLKKLTREHVSRIDQLLESLDEYGEVHLIVQHGQLRYINKVESFKAWRNDSEP